VAKRRARREASRTGRPIIPTAADIDVEGVTVMPDGRVFQRTVFGLTEEQVGRIRAGYTCVKCLEDHDSPFPTQCSVCKFPMAEAQAEEFAKDFRGDIKFGPSTTLDEERDIMNEMREKERFDRLRAAGVLLPSWY
jgi:hypothetical protein